MRMLPATATRFRTREKSVRFKMIDNSRILLSNANLLKCCSKEPPASLSTADPPRRTEITC